MDFQPTDEEKTLREMARGFLDKEIVPIADEYDRRYQPLSKEMAIELFQKLVPLGFVGGLIPREEGGSGLSFVLHGILFEELARAFSGLAYMTAVHNDMGVALLSRIGTDRQKAKWLRPLARGKMIAGFAVTEPNRGSQASDFETVAVRDGKDRYVVNGAKIMTSNATILDLVGIIVTTHKGERAREGTTYLLVDKSESEFEARGISKLGFRCQSIGELVFRDCRVPQENLIGKEGEGLRLAFNFIRLGRCHHALMAVGIAQSALELTVKYIQERTLFNKPVGRHQFTAGMIYEMAAEVEAARLLSYKALDLVEKGVATEMEPSMAKAYATETSARVTSKAIEIHGIYGLSGSSTVERLFRDGRMLTIPDGANEIHKLIVARHYTRMGAFT